MTGKVVHRIEDGTDRREVLATTYQMRNFYKQLRDGFFTTLDTFNYSQHHQIARIAANMPDARVLDVCCGRGLLLPLLRYHAKGIGSYTGVDIEPRNAVWLDQRVTDGKPIERGEYYPWPTTFVEANAASMDEHPDLQGESFDLIVYTASIEHMQPGAGADSLKACRALAHTEREGTLMILTCPNTPEDQDGFDTARRAHVYEWKLSELQGALKAAGWRTEDVWGINGRLGDLEKVAERQGWGHVFRRLKEHVPSEWLAPALAPILQKRATEIALSCRPM